MSECLCSFGFRGENSEHGRNMERKTGRGGEVSLGEEATKQNAGLCKVSTYAKTADPS